MSVIPLVRKIVYVAPHPVGRLTGFELALFRRNMMLFGCGHALDYVGTWLSVALPLPLQRQASMPSRCGMKPFCRKFSNCTCYLEVAVSDIMERRPWRGTKGSKVVYFNCAGASKVQTERRLMKKSDGRGDCERPRLGLADGQVGGPKLKSP